MRARSSLGIPPGRWRASLLLLAGLGLAHCRPAAGPVSVTEAPLPATATPAPTAAPNTPTAVPAASATPAATATATATAPVPGPVTVTCAAGEPWSQTQAGVTLSLCFEPYPPGLGVLTAFEAVVQDAAGQPIVDAAVDLTLVGGMAGMEGEHDEDFSVALEHRAEGRYAALARIGPDDLVLTEVRVEVWRGQERWSFMARAEEFDATY